MKALQEDRRCKQHGLTRHKLMSGGVNRRKKWQCVWCIRERQAKMKLGKKLRLVEEAGGKCQICGYNACYASLEFHHLDPATKEYKLSEAVARFSMEICRREIAKCVLVCSNCHGEIEVCHEPTMEKLNMIRC